MNYSNYDARGHAGRKIDGPNDLTFTYDRAERVAQVRETGGAQRVLKAFTYGTSNVSGVWDNGKVKTADRYNYTSILTAQIKETYFYGGRQGRASQRDTQATVDGVAREAFTQFWTYNDLGQVASIGYPDCTHSPCGSQVPDPEAISFSYTNGFLSSVPGHASPIAYHPNGMVSQVSHANAVIETYGLDPNWMRRPLRISAAEAGEVRWDSGNYQYDGTGSVAKVGNAVYLYDSRQRLVSGKVYLGSTGGGTVVNQSYSYDSFGNIQEVSGTSGRSTPTSSLTNRLTGSVAHDSAGNLTLWNGTNYFYDAFNQMTSTVTGGQSWYYFYTADDERIWMYDISGGFKRWELRGLDNQILASYVEQSGSWSRERQLVYRDGILLAAKTPSGWNRFHVDHLGTPRAVTNLFGNSVAYHAYYGFGEEATAFNQDDERMKFTGHERDLASPAGAADDLDYMHARHYNLWTGRFLSTDRVEGVVTEPQSWNRFTYVINRPLTYVDPDGNEGELPDHYCGGWPDREILPAPVGCSPAAMARCAARCQAEGRMFIGCEPGIALPPFFEIFNCRCAPFPIRQPIPPPQRPRPDRRRRCPLVGSNIEGNHKVCLYQCPGEPFQRLLTAMLHVDCPSSITP